MHYRILTVVAGLAILISIGAHKLSASDHDVKTEPAPDCPYGYFDSAPYNCAPYGYYGPEWFQGGVFIGVGPWFHGSKRFHGQVDDHYNPRDGYKGDLPRNGDRPDPQHPVDRIEHFRPTQERDGRGNEYREHSH